MDLVFKDSKTNAHFRLVTKNPQFDRLFYTRDRQDKLLTIAWNRGAAQKVVVDNITHEFLPNTILPLMVNPSFNFEAPENIVAWQFNRDFYCIVDHDHEVSCVGFLFFGTSQTLFITLTPQDEQKINALLEVFQDEFEQADNIQGAMLRMLLVRLIITVTRLAKQQHIGSDADDDTKFALYRNFNLMVENHYKQQHEVQFYASALNKSPKTLSNVFALYGKKPPLQIIQERVTLEARRLFVYTDKSAKEVAAELGFEDASHFSRFFKNQTDQSPSDYKRSLQKAT